MNPDKHGSRLTGGVLSNLAETQLNLGESSSVIRPFHTPVLVVLTTGKSDDSSEQDAIKMLNDRLVDIIIAVLSGYYVLQLVCICVDILRWDVG